MSYYDEDDDDDFILGDIPATLQIVYEADLAVRAYAYAYPDKAMLGECDLQECEPLAAKEQEVDDWLADYEVAEQTFTSA